MRIAEITDAIAQYAPLDLQEGYDNAGLQIGDNNNEATGVLLCVDVTEAIVDEAIEKNVNLIISHHPLLFKGLKSITGKNQIERIVLKALKNDIAIYSAHTNMDNTSGGVSAIMADKLHLVNQRVLRPMEGKLYKLVVFAPKDYTDKVSKALFEAGAGRLGNYDSCSYKLQGEGSFRALEGANPWVGDLGEVHHEKETRIEVLLNNGIKSQVVKKMIAAHPYEEPAYDLIALENESKYSGSGIVGELIEKVPALEFLSVLKKTFGVGAVKYSGNVSKEIKTVALCGGSGAEFIGDALRARADIYVTGDLKYHEFTSNNDRILLADIGHYESEQYTKEIFNNIIRKKFPNFATYYAELENNPINYL